MVILIVPQEKAVGNSLYKQSFPVTFGQGSGKK